MPDFGGSDAGIIAAITEDKLILPLSSANPSPIQRRHFSVELTARISCGIKIVDMTSQKYRGAFGNSVRSFDGRS